MSSYFDIGVGVQRFKGVQLNKSFGTDAVYYHRDKKLTNWINCGILPGFICFPLGIRRSARTMPSKRCTAVAQCMPVYSGYEHRRKDFSTNCSTARWCGRPRAARPQAIAVRKGRDIV